MNINWSAMWKAVGLSLLISIIVGVVLGVLGAAVDPNAATATTSLDGLLTGTAVVGSLIGLALMLLYGALYGYFARREGTPVDGGNYAVGGALTVVMLGIVNVILGALLLAIGPDLATVIPGTGMSEGGIVGLLTAAALISLLVNAVIGAIGGAIYAATHRTATTTNRTAM